MGGDLVRRCGAPSCDDAAAVEVTLYDVYPDGQVFFEQDYTCPYLCEDHVAENERSVSGERRPRRITVYKYTNQNGAQGFTIYRPIT